MSKKKLLLFCSLVGAQTYGMDLEEQKVASTRSSNISYPDTLYPQQSSAQRLPTLIKQVTEGVDSFIHALQDQLKKKEATTQNSLDESQLTDRSLEPDFNAQLLDQGLDQIKHLSPKDFWSSKPPKRKNYLVKLRYALANCIPCFDTEEDEASDRELERLTQICDFSKDHPSLSELFYHFRQAHFLRRLFDQLNLENLHFLGFSPYFTDCPLLYNRQTKDAFYKEEHKIKMPYLSNIRVSGKAPTTVDFAKRHITEENNYHLGQSPDKIKYFKRAETMEYLFNRCYQECQMDSQLYRELLKSYLERTGLMSLFTPYLEGRREVIECSQLESHKGLTHQRIIDLWLIFLTHDLLKDFHQILRDKSQEVLKAAISFKENLNYLSDNLSQDLAKNQPLRRIARHNQSIQGHGSEDMSSTTLLLGPTDFPLSNQTSLDMLEPLKGLMNQGSAPLKDWINLLSLEADPRTTNLAALCSQTVLRKEFPLLNLEKVTFLHQDLLRLFNYKKATPPVI